LRTVNRAIEGAVDLPAYIPLTIYSYWLMFLFCSELGIGNTVDWERAIERNSEALVGIVEALFAMLGIVGDATADLPLRFSSRWI
jgi:uncharacterized membrane protein